jgi:hypothetical protein
MKDHVWDVVSGGGNITRDSVYTIGFYRDEIRIRKNYSLRKDYEPQDVSETEQRLYDFLEKEKIDVCKTGYFHCEVFIASFNGYYVVSFPMDAEYREDEQDRLVALAHETGHYLDLKYNHNFDAVSFDSKDDYEFTLSKEIQAWQFAYDILMGLGFVEWESFLDRMKMALTTYFEQVGRESEVSEHVSAISQMLRNES